ncbi:MAG TPA: cytochrome c [Burkholderiaceae bacterium]|nr:cytochrome c [Burkholderiaceae bacterium]
MSIHRTGRCASAVLALSLLTSATFAQQKTDLGKREFENNCAACHGSGGKGNGPFGELLKRSPSDLTTMAQRNSGVFPVARAYEVIEGGGTAHGSRDMPIWGQDYSIKAAEYFMDVPYDREAYVRGRILALIEYLNRLQAK